MPPRSRECQDVIDHVIQYGEECRAKIKALRKAAADPNPETRATGCRDVNLHLMTYFSKLRLCDIFRKFDLLDGTEAQGAFRSENPEIVAALETLSDAATAAGKVALSGRIKRKPPASWTFDRFEHALQDFERTVETGESTEPPSQDECDKPGRRKEEAKGSSSQEWRELETDDDRAVAKLHRWLNDGRKFKMTAFAEALGVPRTAMYDRKRFPIFLALLEAHKRDLPDGDRGEDGDVEAWDSV
jgi:hypothetical protein